MFGHELQQRPRALEVGGKVHIMALLIALTCELRERSKRAPFSSSAGNIAGAMRRLRVEKQTTIKRQ